MTGLSLLMYSWGGVFYWGYSFFKPRDVDRSPSGALLAGFGGLVYIFSPAPFSVLGLALEAWGTLIILDMAPDPWAPVKLTEDGQVPPPSAAKVAFGGILMILSVPALAFASMGFWISIILLFNSLASTAPQEMLDMGTTSFYTVLGAIGAGLFYFGYGQAGMRDFSVWVRSATIGAAVLVFSWFPLMRTWYKVTARASDSETATTNVARTQGVAQAAVAPPPAVPKTVLASADGSLSLTMPDCWKTQGAAGTVLYAACGAKTLTLTEAGGPVSIDVLTGRAILAENAAKAAGAQSEGSPKMTLLEGNKPLVAFLYRQNGSRFHKGEFTLKQRSYELSWKDLDEEDNAALVRSLDALATR